MAINSCGSFFKWQNISASNDFLQLSGPNGTILGGINSSGQPFGSLSTASVIQFAGVPTGPCLGTQIAVNSGTGDLYSCSNGVWVKVGPTAGSLVSPITSPNPLAFDVNLAFKGPNPWTDVTRYGARALIPNATPAAVGITATINSGSALTTVSTTSCPGQIGSVCFMNGDGVVVYGAGAAHSLATPGAPTIVPSLAIAGTGTGNVVNGPTGSTTYCYRVVARTKNGGLTAAGPETCITNGQASLGVPTPVAISSVTRTNDIVSITTATPHGFPVGCSVTTCGEVYITGVVDGQGVMDLKSFDGWWAVESAIDSTHFTFSSSSDTRNGAVNVGSGGTAQWFNCNRVTWPQVTGAWEYYIYGGASGAETLKGVSTPQGTITSDLTWDDFGSPMMDNFSFPPFVPNAFPVAATPDHLVSTIVSGAGTTTLTLKDSASTSVVGATIRFDNAPAFFAAASDVSNRSSSGNEGGSIYIPLNTLTGDNYYVINSYLDFSLGGLPNMVPISQVGQMWLNETWEMGFGQRWYGDRVLTKGQATSFAPQYNPAVYVNTAHPGVYIGNNNLGHLGFKGLAFAGTVSNGALLVFAEGQFSYGFDQIGFSTSSGTLDYMGIGLYIRGVTGQSAAMGRLTNIVAVAGSTSIGPPSQDGFTHTPVIFCNVCGATRMEGIFMAHRNIVFVGTSEGGSNVTLDLGYTQGSVMPFFTATRIQSGLVRLSNVTMDSTIHPRYVALPSGGTASNGTLIIDDIQQQIIGGAGSSPRVVSGLRVPTQGIVDITGEGANTNPSRSASAIISGGVSDGIFGVDSNYMINANAAAIAVNPSYPIFVVNATPPAPTCTVSAGGSVALGTYTFRIGPVWWNGSQGLDSFPSSPCTTTSGQQTITVNWGVIPGNPKSYTVLASSGGGTASVSGGTGLTGTSLVISSGTPGSGGTSWSNLPSGGPTMMMPGVQGMVTPTLFIAPGLVSALPAASASNAGQMRGVTDSTTISSEGQTCVGGGTVAALAFSNGTIWKCF